MQSIEAIKEAFNLGFINENNLHKYLRVNISKTLRYEILKKYNFRCVCCDCKLKYSKHNKFFGKVAEIDHIHPLKFAYSYINGFENINEIENLQPLCKDCNLWKKDKIFNYKQRDDNSK